MFTQGLLDEAKVDVKSGADVMNAIIVQLPLRNSPGPWLRREDMYRLTTQGAVGKVEFLLLLHR